MQGHLSKRRDDLPSDGLALLADARAFILVRALFPAGDHHFPVDDHHFPADADHFPAAMTTSRGAFPSSRCFTSASLHLETISRDLASTFLHTIAASRRANIML
jgi:hypothetical protein